MSENPICPKCGGEAVPHLTEWGLKHTHCGLWSWGGKDLVDGETHDARKAAHKALDPVWKSGRVSRSMAYKLLAQALELPHKKVHMNIMDKETARRVPDAVRKIWGEQHG